jgi:hypothetical protein
MRIPTGLAVLDVNASEVDDLAAKEVKHARRAEGPRQPPSILQ